MGDLLIFETAQNMHQGIGFPDVPQELVAQPLTQAGPPHQTSDIDELNAGRGATGRLQDLVQPKETFVGNLHHADIGVDRAERVVGSFCCSLSQGIEKS